MHSRRQVLDPLEIYISKWYTLYFCHPKMCWSHRFIPTFEYELPNCPNIGVSQGEQYVSRLIYLCIYAHMYARERIMDHNKPRVFSVVTVYISLSLVIFGLFLKSFISPEELCTSCATGICSKLYLSLFPTNNSHQLMDPNQNVAEHQSKLSRN